jgi:hypothetical protein
MMPDINISDIRMSPKMNGMEWLIKFSQFILPCNYFISAYTAEKNILNKQLYALSCHFYGSQSNVNDLNRS